MSYWTLVILGGVGLKCNAGALMARPLHARGTNRSVKGVVMVFTVVVALVAVVVAVGMLQNGQAVTVSFFFWQFEAPLALIILAATGAGLAIGVLVGWARALTRWRHTRPAAGVRDSLRPVRR